MAHKMDAENRKDKLYLVRNLEVFWRDAEKILDNIINLSLRGMLIAHEAAMLEGLVLKIKIVLGHVSNGLSEIAVDV